MSLLPPSRYFPPAEAAGPRGLICVGGELSEEWLLDAYAQGIFPWPLYDGRLAWWSPNPRAIIELDGLHVSRRLARTIRNGVYEATRDADFAGVVDGCATAQGRRRGTWITPELVGAYQMLHKAGHAHSVEARRQGQLAGGVYGVAIGGLFAAESMFYYLRDASKVALAHLFEHLRTRGFQLFDIQQLTPHTQRLGAVEISRDEYLTRLAKALQADVRF